MNKHRIKNIFKLVARDIALFFPYYLLLYFFIFVMHFFFAIWLSFWKVPALHYSLIFFGLLFALEQAIPFYTERFSFENDRKSFIQTFRETILKIQWSRFFKNLYKIKSIFKTFFKRENIKQFSKKVYLLICGFISLIIYWTGFYGTKILIFCWKTLKLFLEKVKNGDYISWTGGLALFFLALCPFLLVFKKDAIAEKSAIYAYYFLVISVVLMIIENYFDKTPEIESEF